MSSEFKTARAADRSVCEAPAEAGRRAPALEAACEISDDSELEFVASASIMAGLLGMDRRSLEASALIGRIGSCGWGWRISG